MTKGRVMDFDWVKRGKESAVLTQGHYVQVESGEDAEALAEVYRHVRMARDLYDQMMTDSNLSRFIKETVRMIEKAESLTARMVNSRYWIEEEQ